MSGSGDQVGLSFAGAWRSAPWCMKLVAGAVILTGGEGTYFSMAGLPAAGNIVLLSGCHWEGSWCIPPERQAECVHLMVAGCPRGSDLTEKT